MNLIHLKITMEVDFDKQIDTILRDLAKGNFAAEALPKSHLEADEFSAFAENALPAKARLRVTEHLADCSKCRKILTTLVTLNIEAESETIHEKARTIVAAPAIPWYRQLFAFPQLAFTMGALVLVFGGMIGYLVMQSANEAQVNVAQADKTTEKTIGPSGAGSDGEGRVVETYSSNSNTASSTNTAANIAAPTANTAANSSSPVSSDNYLTDKQTDPAATPAAPVATAPTTVGPEVEAKTAEKLDADLKTNKDLAKEEVVNKKSGDPPASKVANEQTTADDVNVSRQQVQSEAPVQMQRNQNNVMMPDGSNQTGRNMPLPAPMRKSETRRDDNESRGAESGGERAKNKVAEKKPEVLKTVGSKTFRFENGIWTDSAYKGGSTKSIRRGSNEYKKLDIGLRNIGDSFSETVIVAWGGKNYKIQ
jgi:hypothetical protein